MTNLDELVLRNVWEQIKRPELVAKRKAESTISHYATTLGHWERCSTAG